jgi:hypothetical protein
VTALKRDRGCQTPAGSPPMAFLRLRRTVWSERELRSTRRSLDSRSALREQGTGSSGEGDRPVSKSAPKSLSECPRCLPNASPAHPKVSLREANGSTTRPRCPDEFVSPRQRFRAFAFRGLILPEIKRASPPSCLPCPLSRPQAGGQSFGGLIPPEVGASRRNAAPHPLMTFSLWGSPSHRGGERLPAPSSHVLSVFRRE